MSIPQTKCLYEKIIPFRRVPFWIFWPMAGIVSIIGGWLLLFLFHETQHPWTLLIFGFFWGGLPTVIIWFFHSFYQKIRSLSHILWVSQIAFDEWLDNSIRKIFFIRSFPSVLFIVLVVFLGNLTIFFLGYPFDNFVTNLLAVTVIIVKGKNNSNYAGLLQVV